MKRRTRRINHTHRMRIDKARVKLRVVSGADVVMLSADVDLADLPIEEDAKVFIDVSRKAQSERFALGTAAAPVGIENSPTPFDSAVGLRYDVVVVGAEDALLLAASRRVRPENADAQESLLAIRPSSELGERTWRLDLYDQPVIEVNDRILNWRDLTDSALFQCLVLPEVVALILQHIAGQGGVDESDDEEPLAQWSRFFVELGVDMEMVSAGDESEALAEEVDRAVRAFAARHAFTTQLLAGTDWGAE